MHLPVSFIKRRVLPGVSTRDRASPHEPNMFRFACCATFLAMLAACAVSSPVRNAQGHERAGERYSASKRSHDRWGERAYRRREQDVARDYDTSLGGRSRDQVSYAHQIRGNDEDKDSYAIPDARVGADRNYKVNEGLDRRDYDRPRDQSNDRVARVQKRRFRDGERSKHSLENELAGNGLGGDLRPKVIVPVQRNEQAATATFATRAFAQAAAPPRFEYNATRENGARAFAPENTRRRANFFAPIARFFGFGSRPNAFPLSTESEVDVSRVEPKGHLEPIEEVVGELEQAVPSTSSAQTDQPAAVEASTDNLAREPISEELSREELKAFVRKFQKFFTAMDSLLEEKDIEDNKDIEDKASRIAEESTALQGDVDEDEDDTRAADPGDLVNNVFEQDDDSLPHEVRSALKTARRIIAKPQHPSDSPRVPETTDKTTPHMPRVTERTRSQHAMDGEHIDSTPDSPPRWSPSYAVRARAASQRGARESRGELRTWMQRLRDTFWSAGGEDGDEAVGLSARDARKVAGIVERVHARALKVESGAADDDEDDDDGRGDGLWRLARQEVARLLETGELLTEDKDLISKAVALRLEADL